MEKAKDFLHFLHGNGRVAIRLTPCHNQASYWPRSVLRAASQSAHAQLAEWATAVAFFFLSKETI